MTRKVEYMGKTKIYDTDPASMATVMIIQPKHSWGKPDKGIPPLFHCANCGRLTTTPGLDKTNCMTD